MSIAEPPSIGVNGEGFPSADALHAAHSVLLQRERAEGPTETFIKAVATFVGRGRLTGLILDNDKERRTSQNILDYWATVLYRVNEYLIDSTLEEFDPSLAPALPDEPKPYVGLEAFQEQTRDRFFGRQQLTTQLLDHIQEKQLLVVVGPSGSGKSSLVLGGLLPALKHGALPNSQQWRYPPSMVPGSDPLTNLARILQPAHIKGNGWLTRLTRGMASDPRFLVKVLGALGEQPTVLIIDQFEEVFTLCRDNVIRTAFIDNLLNVANVAQPRHRVILTIRSDFEPAITRIPALHARYRDAQQRITPMGAGELREAIEEPAKKVGLRFEEGLVDTLVNDIIGEKAALPLLQFTLRRLWEQRERNRVTWASYRRLGSGRLALAHSADAFYNNLSPELQQTVQRILLRMVRPADGLEFTSNRIPVKDLYRSSEADYRVTEVLGKLEKAQLVRITDPQSPDAQIEVAHEALIRNWPKLIDWLETERERIRERRRLTDAAEQWKLHGNDANLLLRGMLLDEALRLSMPELTPTERAFVRASLSAKIATEERERRQHTLEVKQARALAEEQRLRAEAEKQRADEEIRRAEAETKEHQERNRAEQQIRARRSLRLLSAILLVALLASMGAGVFAWDAGNKAQSEAYTRATAEANAIAAKNDLATSVSQARTSEAQAQTAAAAADAAKNDLATSVSQARTSEAQAQTAAAAADAAKQIAQAEANARAIAEINAGAAAENARNEANARATAQVAAEIALASERAAKDALSQELKRRRKENAVQLVRQAQAASDAQQALRYALAAAQRDEDKDDELQKYLQASPNYPSTSLNSQLTSATWSADSSSLVTGSNDGKVILWDAATLRKKQEFVGLGRGSVSIAWSPNDSRLAGGSGNTVRVWNLGDGATSATHTISSAITGLAWAPDSEKILISSIADDQLYVWNLLTKTNDFVISNAGSVKWAAWSPDGQQFVTARNNEAVVWNAKTGGELLRLRNHTQPVTSASFSPDGQRVATSSKDSTVRVWNVAGTAPVEETRFTIAKPIRTVFWSPDGQTIVGAGDDAVVYVWRPSDKTVVHQLQGSNTGVTIAIWSPSGRSVVAGSGTNLRVFPVDHNDLITASIQALQPLQPLTDDEVNKILLSVPTATLAPTITPVPTSTPPSTPAL